MSNDPSNTTDPSTTPSQAGGDEQTSNATAPEPEPPTGALAGSIGATASSLEEGRPEEGSDDGDDDDASEGGAEGDAQAGAEGAPKKKRRRRRKKKPGAPGEGAQAGAEGQPAEGAEGAAAPGGPQGERREGGGKNKKKKEPRPERERPAFNVGDVVFGKVLEVTEDVLFVDLAGKAKAIFDLRELAITEDEAEEYDRAHKKEEEERRAETAQRAAAEATREAAKMEGEGGGASADEPVAAAAGAADHVAVEQPSPSNPAVAQAALTEAVATGAPTETTGAEAAPEGAAATAEAAKPEDERPQLPRVILEPGASFVGLVHNDGGRGGLVVLTHHPKRVSKAKPVLAEASRSGALVFGLVTGTIKGGVEVDVDGLRAFAPASHMDLRPGADLSHLVGKRLGFAVTQYAKRGRDVVLSRRAMLESEYKEKREKALSGLQIGSVVDGVVRTVVQFGAFIDVGGVEGLVPLSEMSHNRGDQPKDVFKVGETVKVKILRVDEKGKLWLSRRSAIEDPWNQVAEKYAAGTRHKGKVARIQPFGAFVELEPGIDGLIHTVDLSVKRIESPEEVVKVGDEVDVVVANVDPRAHRIALHPAPTGEAANEEPQRIGLNKHVKVVVVAVETGGLTVRILGATGRHARGFITASATGTPRGTELKKLFPVGKQLDAKIIEQDPRRGELKLSIRALNDETERNAYQQYRAQVKREAKFGTLADLLAKRGITPGK